MFSFSLSNSLSIISRAFKIDFTVGSLSHILLYQILFFILSEIFFPSIAGISALFCSNNFARKLLEFSLTLNLKLFNLVLSTPTYHDNNIKVVILCCPSIRALKFS